MFLVLNFNYLNPIKHVCSFLSDKPVLKIKKSDKTATIKVKPMRAEAPDKPQVSALLLVGTINMFFVCSVLAR